VYAYIHGLYIQSKRHREKEKGVKRTEGGRGRDEKMRSLGKESERVTRANIYIYRCICTHTYVHIYSY